VLEKLYDYLDKELVESEQEKLKQHLDVCSSCLKRYNLEKSVEETIRGKLNQSYDVEPLKTKILGEIDKIDHGNGGNIFYLLAPLAAAAVIALAFIFPLNGGPDPTEVYQAASVFANQHSRCLEHLLNYTVESSDPRIVDSCMSQLMEIPKELFEYSSPSIVITAGTVAKLPGGEEAQLEYLAFGDTVSVFVNRHNSIDTEVFRTMHNGDKSMLVGSCTTYRYVIWECHGVECIAVSKLPKEQLVQFASSF
jgi:anti-sigma factor (TIGR02949 family)